jgi:hypothetical protein
MRTVAIVALALLLLPNDSSAQRMRLPGARRPRPAELPPQAPGVAREMQYVRLPLSFESYPLVSRIEASGFMGDGVSSSWTSFGMGTRADYRVSRFLSATLDMTSSFNGGPMVMETAELGARMRPDRNERRLYPFVDARVGYAYAYHSYYRPIGDVIDGSNALPLGYGSRFSHGLGAVGGAGMEIAITTRFSMTTAASIMRNHMTAQGFQGNRPTRDRFWMTSYRYMLGVRYNPVRMITASPTT